MGTASMAVVKTEFYAHNIASLHKSKNTLCLKPCIESVKRYVTVWIIPGSAPLVVKASDHHSQYAALQAAGFEMVDFTWANAHLPAGIPSATATNGQPTTIPTPQEGTRPPANDTSSASMNGGVPAEVHAAVSEGGAPAVVSEGGVPAGVPALIVLNGVPAAGFPKVQDLTAESRQQQIIEWVENKVNVTTPTGTTSCIAGWKWTPDLRSEAWKVDPQQDGSKNARKNIQNHFGKIMHAYLAIRLVEVENVVVWADEPTCHAHFDTSCSIGLLLRDTYKVQHPGLSTVWDVVCHLLDSRRG